MPQYLVANYLPDEFDPSVVTEAMMEEIHALNREMIAAGVRKFACGISPAGNAKTLRAQPNGKVLVTDGPYTETKEWAARMRAARMMTERMIESVQGKALRALRAAAARAQSYSRPGHRSRQSDRRIAGRDRKRR